MRWQPAILVLTILAGCADGGQTLVTGDGPASTSSRQPGGRGDGLVLSVDVRGGFLPPGAEFAYPPTAVVYEDGSIFSPGAVATIYPGPAVAPLVQGRIGADQLDRLVAAADEAGLLAATAPDAGLPPIADAATTTATVVVDGQTHVTSVYALERGPDLGGQVPGVSPEQAGVRDAVANFLDLVEEIMVLGDGELYQPDRYRVLPLPTSPPPDQGIEPGEQAWPLPEIPLAQGECIALDGTQAQELGGALDQATEITRWRSESGVSWSLAVRPVLPHEPGCPR